MNQALYDRMMALQMVAISRDLNKEDRKELEAIRKEDPTLARIIDAVIQVRKTTEALGYPVWNGPTNRT